PRLPRNEGATRPSPDPGRRPHGRKPWHRGSPRGYRRSMASSSDPWSERRQSPHGPVDPSQRSVSQILGTPERPTILPGATPQWPGHEYGNTVPPRPEPIPGVPGAVRRQRAELEALRDDAARQYHAGEAARVQVYANHRKEAAVAQGVWAAAARSEERRVGEGGGSRASPPPQAGVGSTDRPPAHR